MIQYDLDFVSTDELLDELRRRCSHEENYTPQWALDVITVCAQVWGTTADKILAVNNQPAPCDARTAAMGIVDFREKNRSRAALAKAFRRQTVVAFKNAVKRCDRKCREDADFREKLTIALKRLNLTNQTCLSPHFAAG